MKNLRYLKHSSRQRIEHDLVLERLGELSVRRADTLTRSLLFGTKNANATIVEGFNLTSPSGLNIAIQTPACAVQNAGNTDDVLQAYEGHAIPNITLAPADPSNPRIDILIARKRTVQQFFDTTTSQADPTTQTINTVPFYRDNEIELEVSSVTGTPAPAPSAPAIPSGSQGTVIGTVGIPGTINLQTEYILNIGVTDEGEFVAVDCRGAVPAATTLSEIVTNINTALSAFGVIASINGGQYLQLTCPGVGEASVIRIKQPSNPAIDAANLILGIAENVQYLYAYRGMNLWFKIGEVTVPTNALTLSPGNILDVYSKASWNADANTVYVGKTLETINRDKNAADGYPGLTTTFQIQFKNILGTIISLIQNANTAIRTYIFQDRDGTVALDYQAMPVGGILPMLRRQTISSVFPWYRLDQADANLAQANYPDLYAILYNLTLDFTGSDLFGVTSYVGTGTAVTLQFNNTAAEQAALDTVNRDLLYHIYFGGTISDWNRTITIPFGGLGSIPAGTYPITGIDPILRQVTFTNNTVGGSAIGNVQFHPFRVAGNTSVIRMFKIVGTGLHSPDEVSSPVNTINLPLFRDLDTILEHRHLEAGHAHAPVVGAWSTYGAGGNSEGPFGINGPTSITAIGYAQIAGVYVWTVAVRPGNVNKGRTLGTYMYLFVGTFQ